MSTRTLLPHFLDRGCITLLAGSSHAGKTTLVGQLIKASSTSDNFLGLPLIRDSRISYMTAGDAKPWQDTLDTFTDIGASLPPERVNTTLEYPVHNPHTSADLLLSTLNDLPSSDLYIIEGLTAFISPISVINYHAPLTGLKQLTQWAESHHAAILGTHHLGKQDNAAKPRRAIDRVLGTTALVGNVSHTAVLETPEELKTPHYRLTFYHRHHAPKTLWLSRADTPGGPFELAEREVEVDTTDIATFLSSMPTEEIHIKELYALGPSERTVKRWLEELTEAGKVKREGKGYYRRV